MADPIRLSLGCGKKLKQGFIGIDIDDHGQEHVLDLGKDKLPFEKKTVDRIDAFHFLEHLTQPEIIHILNQCHYILKHGACLHIVVPHKDHDRAYVLWHKTFFNEFTFEDLEAIGKWEIVELIVNNRLDIHCQLKKI